MFVFLRERVNARPRGMGRDRLAAIFSHGPGRSNRSAPRGAAVSDEALTQGWLEPHAAHRIGAFWAPGRKGVGALRRSEDAMDSVDLEVMRAAVSWVEAGRGATIGTVTQTWGSAPRPVGAMLVIRDDGHVMGSVSAGCAEDDL